MSDLAEVSLLVAFSDFTGFAVQAERVENAELAGVLDAYYELVGARIDRAGGQVVKFIGDAALIVFPPAAVDSGVAALLDLKDAADQFMEERDWDCRLRV